MDNHVNEFELLQVMEDLRARGLSGFRIRPGNGCVFVSVPHGGFTTDMYYYFRNGRLVNVEVD
jgi:hypothetical protein